MYEVLWPQLTIPGTVPSHHFGWFFPQLCAVSSEIYTDHYFAEYSGTPSINLWGFSGQLPPVHCCALQTLAAFVSLYSKLYLLKSETTLGSAWFPLPMPQPGNTLKAVTQDNHRAYFIFFCLSGVIIFCCMVVQCLKNHCLIYFVQVHSYFRCGG